MLSLLTLDQHQAVTWQQRLSAAQLGRFPCLPALKAHPLLRLPTVLLRSLHAIELPSRAVAGKLCSRPVSQHLR